jgi:hypothetical protein
MSFKVTNFEKWLIALAVLLLLAGGLLKAYGQEAATPKPLTPDEKAQVSRAEITLLRAQQKKEDDQKNDDKAIAQASQDLNREIQKVYTERKIQADQWTLCENPGPPYCLQAPVNDLSLQPVPKPDTKEKK